MYVENLNLENIRTFARSELSFLHPDIAFRSPDANGDERVRLLPRPKLPNVNLLLGDNASGKTTILQAIALVALGPAARDAQLPIRRLVRYPSGHEPSLKDNRPNPNHAYIRALLYMHRQECIQNGWIGSVQQLERRGELESIEFAGDAIDDKYWAPVYESANAAFFCVACGATRRVESVDSPRRDHRGRFMRARRVQSIFQDDFVINSMANWLSCLKESDPARYDEVSRLLKQMIGPGHFLFAGTIEDDELRFERGGTSVPFSGLSDGYRGLIGWVGDLLYHLCFACPRGQPLIRLRGVAMVDQVDLLLDPKWQMKVISTVAKALPRMQFIFTSQSPLVAGSLEWMNIITLKLSAKTNRTSARRLEESIHGLDAEQVLISRFFGLSTTRAPGKVRRLDRLTVKARAGDQEAAKQIFLELAWGTEPTE